MAFEVIRVHSSGFGACSVFVRRACSGTPIPSLAAQLVVEPDDGIVFLSNAGEPFSLDRLSDLVRVHIHGSNIGKRGACHLLRHTIATVMLARGVDICYTHPMVGHPDLIPPDI